MWKHLLVIVAFLVLVVLDVGLFIWWFNRQFGDDDSVETFREEVTYSPECAEDPGDEARADQEEGTETQQRENR